jgi:hypothetical protein
MILKDAQGAERPPEQLFDGIVDGRSMSNKQKSSQPPIATPCVTGLSPWF